MKQANQSKSRTTRNGKNENEEEQIENEDEYEYTDDDDAREDLVAVIKAFTKSKQRREKNAAKLAQANLDKVFADANDVVDKMVKRESTKCDKYVRGLKLDDDQNVAGPSATFFSPLLEKQFQQEAKLAELLGTVSDASLAASSQFCPAAVEAVKRRPQQARKAHKQYKKLVKDQATDQIEMAALYAQSGPLILKHVKSLAAV